MAGQPQNPQHPDSNAPSPQDRKKQPAGSGQIQQPPGKSAAPKGMPAATAPKVAAKKSGEGKKGKKSKKPKINFNSLDYRIEVAQEYTNLWQKFFTFFGEGFEGRRISEAQEKEFHQVIQQLARQHYPYCEIIGDLLDNGSKNQIIDIISETVSLSHIKMISVSEFNTLMQDWHSVFISMNIALGHMLGEKESLVEKKRTKEARKKGKQKTKEPVVPPTPPLTSSDQKPEQKKKSAGPAPSGKPQPQPQPRKGAPQQAPSQKPPSG